MLKQNLSGRSASKMRSALNLIGGFLGLAGVVFVCFKVSQQISDIQQYRFEKTQIYLFLILALVYGTANTFIAAGWHFILKRLGVCLSWKESMSAYGISQLAKYVPGNIFQFVGRQALGVSVGAPGGRLAKSVVFEIILLVIAALLLAVPALQLWLPHASESTTFLTTLTLVFLSSVPLIFKKEFLILSTLLLNMFFFITSGLVFWAVLNALANLSNGPATISEISSAFILAWLLGFLTPGAPAGLGIREYIILFSLTGIATEPLLLLSVVISRLTTMAGDLIFYLGSLTVKYYLD